MDRLEALRARLREQELDGVLLVHLPDIRWLTGFTGSSAYVVVLPEAVYFLTDGRYTQQAQEEVHTGFIFIYKESPWDVVEEEAWLTPGLRLGLQAEHTPLQLYTQVRERFASVSWIPVLGLTDPLRGRKQAVEIEAMRQAQALTDRIFLELLEVLRPGLREREVAAEITYRALRYGADGLAFPPIVASGPRSALPHATPTDRLLRRGDVVLLDFGCVYHGYASDMTRVVVLGEASEEVRQVYEVVLRAQEVVLEVARAGMTGEALDRLAREVIQEAGYGDYFTHSLGHGLGLEIHEWPSVSRRGKEPLPEGTVLTVEPGIYLPGRFGVRIEDMVVLREGGNERLTSSPKDLRVL